MILSFGIGPFTQQVVKNVACKIPHETSKSSIPIQRYLRPKDFLRDDLPYRDLDMNTKVVILDSLSNPNTARPVVSPSCSTGNCSFPSYNGVTHSSLGMCKECFDITRCVSESGNDLHELNATREFDGDLILPNGHGISAQRTVLNITNRTWWDFLLTDDVPDNTLLATSPASIFNASIIAFTRDNCGQDHDSQFQCHHPRLNISSFWDTWDVAAVACTFYPCVRNYHGSVDNAEFTVIILSETPILKTLHQEMDPFPNHQSFNTPCVVDGTMYTLDNISSIPESHNLSYLYVDDERNISVPDACVYGVSGIYTYSVMDCMTLTLKGYCDVASSIAFGPETSSDAWETLYCTDWFIQSLLNKGNASFESIDANIQAIALAITSEMRKQPGSWNVRLDMAEFPTRLDSLDYDPAQSPPYIP